VSLLEYPVSQVEDIVSRLDDFRVSAGIRRVTAGEGRSCHRWIIDAAS